MRTLFLAIPVMATLLAGCASHPVDASGVWVNENAIEAALKGGNLRQALLGMGPTLEWQIDSAASKATSTNGFEVAEGVLATTGKGEWRVDFYGNGAENLALEGKELVQSASDTAAEQRFTRPEPAQAALPPGGAFEHQLYAAYMGGNWTVSEGSGLGTAVRFLPDGHVEGLEGIDRYALCLGGDCAAMSGAFDSIWLQGRDQGAAYILQRTDHQLDIYQAANQAAEGEMPSLRPGAVAWRLTR
ncbi:MULTISPECIES: hypothetical protein [Pseudomonas]|uniref:Lipoprotein n=1 Tax=Pseudomonas quercus TaxID=2722792 RepID=A0ABX0YBZ9_9PSED|nr:MULTISPECIES: hypothetical protein [Pseudomonas]MBF7142362.1 hypothetical protein [Pseudomonas sp. LY10J]NJP00900.1 hypothetical protein [Pseudomonas quercus]